MWDVQTFPWLVAVAFLNEDDSLPSLLCSGAAVSKFVVVAPAHCISGVSGAQLASCWATIVDTKLCPESGNAGL